MDDCDGCANGMNRRIRAALLAFVMFLLLLSIIPIVYFTFPALTGTPRIQVPRRDLTGMFFEPPAKTSVGLILEATDIINSSPTLPSSLSPTLQVFQQIITFTPPAANNEQAAEATSILQLVNAARINEGLEELALEPRLMQAALLHSQDQAKRDEMSHDGAADSQPHERVKQAGYNYCITGENVAMRFDVSAVGVFDQWWNSPPHRENIMTSDFVDIGIGFATSTSRAVYYTMVLGKQC